MSMLNVNLYNRLAFGDCLIMLRYFMDLFNSLRSNFLPTNDTNCDKHLILSTLIESIFLQKLFAAFVFIEHPSIMTHIQILGYK